MNIIEFALKHNKNTNTVITASEDSYLIYIDANASYEHVMRLLERDKIFEEIRNMPKITSNAFITLKYNYFGSYLIQSESPLNSIGIDLGLNPSLVIFDHSNTPSMGIFREVDPHRVLYLKENFEFSKSINKYEVIQKLFRYSIKNDLQKLFKVAMIPAENFSNFNQKARLMTPIVKKAVYFHPIQMNEIKEGKYYPVMYIEDKTIINL